MNTVKNPLYILEAAKSILAKEQLLAVSKPKDPRMIPVNEEIKHIKEILAKNNIGNTVHNVEIFVQSCREKGLLSEFELKNVNDIEHLLDLLYARRKSLKENNPASSLNIQNSSYNSISHELFIPSLQYTIRTLCDEFSCSDKTLTPDFVRAKKNLCCSKLKYLLSQHEHCEDLTKFFEKFNNNFDIKLNKEDMPKLEKSTNLNLDAISNKAMKITYSEYPDLEANNKLLRALSNFRKHIVSEIDSCCNKIDLANNFLKSMEKTTHIAFNPRVRH